MRVDLIIPFVDSADELWACEYYKEFGESPMSKFRGNEEIFKCNLRSIAKYLPWINQVYVLVMSESQIPKWLNTSTVKIIYHKDFIPEKYLPTFNECTIELFQHKIPGLSEHYLVGNDDYLVTAPLSREDFFTDEGIPKITWNKGLNIENVTCQDVFDDPKFIEMRITDGERSLWCRSILAAEYSDKMIPHFRFIITERK